MRTTVALYSERERNERTRRTTDRFQRERDFDKSRVNYLELNDKLQRRATERIECLCAITERAYTSNYFVSKKTRIPMNNINNSNNDKLQQGTKRELTRPFPRVPSTPRDTHSLAQGEKVRRRRRRAFPRAHRHTAMTANHFFRLILLTKKFESIPLSNTVSHMIAKLGCSDQCAN